jgi:hypothetical protein
VDQVPFTGTGGADQCLRAAPTPFERSVPLGVMGLKAGTCTVDNVSLEAGLIGGEPAVMLDGMPGQHLSRQVVVVHGGRLYRLTFVPSDRSLAESYEQMEHLYASVLDSFRFVR